MSGKIELKTRIGLSKNPWVVGYPEWFLEITGEDDKTKINISPSWDDIENLITSIKVHELRTDKCVERKNDADRWQETVEKASNRAQSKLKEFTEIPEIYNKTFLAVSTIEEFLRGKKVDEEKLKSLDKHCYYQLYIKQPKEKRPYGWLKELFENYLKNRK